MNEIRLLMPEISLIATLIIFVFFLVEEKNNKFTSKNVLNIIFVSGILTSLIWLFYQFFNPSIIITDLSFYKDHLGVIMKMYFVVSAIYYIFHYSSRFYIIERISIISLMLGVFVLSSTYSLVISFSSFALILVSFFGFIITRFRPNIETVTIFSISLILIILYETYNEIPLLIMILLAIAAAWKVKVKEIEGLIITFIIPLILYISLRYSLHNVVEMWFFDALKISGLLIISIASLLVFSKKNKSKIIFKYSLFYIGHIVFLIGFNTMETNILALLLILYLPLIYNSSINIVSVLNLSMLPPSPIFLIKISILSIVFKGDSVAAILVMIISSLILSVYPVTMLHSNFLQNSFKIRIRPAYLNIVSIVFIIWSLFCFDNIRIVLNNTLRSITG